MFRRFRERQTPVPQDADGASVAVGTEAPTNDVDSPLARAWFEKRKQQLESRQNAATAVDVDAVPSWNADSKTKKKRIKPNNEIADNDSMLEGSAQSIITDKTPVVSNQRPGFKRKPTERSLLPSFTTVVTNNNGELSCKDVFDIRKWHGKVSTLHLFT